jgi:hypothetical protein
MYVYRRNIEILLGMPPAGLQSWTYMASEVIGFHQDSGETIVTCNLLDQEGISGDMEM